MLPEFPRRLSLLAAAVLAAAPAFAAEGAACAARPGGDPRAQQRFSEACAALEKGDLSAAKAGFDAALGLDTRFLDAYAHRAVVLSLQGQPGDASVDYYEAGKAPSQGKAPAAACPCGPVAAKGLLRLGEATRLAREAKARAIALFLKGDKAGARGELDAALSADPGDGEAYQSRAVVREAAGDWRGALDDYEKGAGFSARRPDFRKGILASRDELRAKWREAILADEAARRAAEETAKRAADEAAQRAADAAAKRAAAEAAARAAALAPKRAVLPAPLGRTPAQSAWCLSELREVGRRAAERVESSGLAGDEALKLLVWLFLAGEFDYTIVEEKDRLLLVLPDLDSVAVSKAEIDAYFSPGSRGQDLVAKLDVWPRMLARPDDFNADLFGRGLAVYDIALTRLARRACPGQGLSCFQNASKRLRARRGLSIPLVDDPPVKASLAAGVSREYIHRRLSARPAPSPELWVRWAGLPFAAGEPQAFLDGFLSRMRDRVWRRAQSRSSPHDPWVTSPALLKALAALYPHERREGAVVFFPRGAEPLVAAKEAAGLVRDAPEAWMSLERGLSLESEDEALALSPYAADELAEMLTVMAGAALRRAAGLARARGQSRIGPEVLREAAAPWDGAFDPPRREAPPKWFREIPVEESGLALPSPEAALHSWEAPDLMPGGLAVLDYDLDGKPDLFFCDGEQARLYRNLGGFRFEDATSPAGLSGVGCAAGASSADFDNDGRPDLLTLHDRDKRNHLFRNASGRFVEATAGLGLSTGPAETTSAVWFDFDRDGRLDLFLLEAEDYHRNVTALGDLRDGRPDRLYRQTKDGRFEDVSARAGLSDVGWGLAALGFDYDGDGWTDLDVLNDFGRNKLFRNLRDGTFREVSRKAGVDTLGNGMGVAVGDFDHDGRPDLFVTYIGEDRPELRRLFPEASPSFRLPYADYYGTSSSRYQQRNYLLRNRGDGTFADVTSARVESVPTGWGWNGFFLDADNRGWLDLFQVNGWWSHQLAYADETKVFWRYDPARGLFRDASEASGLDFAGNSRVSAAADLDGDGCQDVLATGFHPIRLFAGRCTAAHHWLGVRLEGVRSNRDGIGAKVKVRAGGLTQTQELGAQGGGFQNGPLRRLHFGLGGAARVRSVEVSWPSGTRQRLGPQEVDRTLVIREEAR